MWVTGMWEYANTVIIPLMHTILALSNVKVNEEASEVVYDSYKVEVVMIELVKKFSNA